MIEARRFYPVLAVASLVIMFHQALDLVSALSANDLATPAGRTRQLLATVARGPALLTADVLLIWSLLARPDLGARFLPRLGMAHFVFGGVFLLLWPVFLFDAGRLASSFRGGEITGFRVVTIRTLLVLPLLGAGAILVGRKLRLAGTVGAGPGPAPEPLPRVDLPRKSL